MQALCNIFEFNPHSIDTNREQQSIEISIEEKMKEFHDKGILTNLDRIIT